MYRYYKTSIKTVNSVTLPDPEPDNWLGYRYKDKYYLKTTGRLSQSGAKEIDGDDIKKSRIDTGLIKDQFV